MKKLLVLLVALLMVTTVAASVEVVPTCGGSCPGCGGADCGSPCLYEVTPGAAAPGTWIPVGDPIDCPDGCHCWDFWPSHSSPCFDPASGKYYEGWCYECENDIPEFTVIGATLVLGLVGLFIYRKRK